MKTTKWTHSRIARVIDVGLIAGAIFVGALLWGEGMRWIMEVLR